MKTPRPVRASRKLLLRDSAAAGIAAAFATTSTAAAAKGLDVSLRVDGKAIPLSGFAFWTVIATALGTVLAVAIHNRNRFLKTSPALTAISLAPAAIAPDHTSTRVVLVATHFVSAAIVIPSLGRRAE